MLQNLPKWRCSLMNLCLSLNWPWRPYMLCLSLVSQFPLGPSLCHGSLLRPGGRLLRQLCTGGLLLCRGGLLLCLLRRGGLLLYTGGLLLRQWRSSAPPAPPWWAPVPYVPPWWAPVSSAPPWWAPVSSALPWWAPVLSAPPWYSALPSLPRFLVSSIPHGPVPPPVSPPLHLPPILFMGSWASLNSPPEVTHSPHGLLHYTHCCTPPQTTIPITHCTDDTRTEHTADCTDHTTYLNHGLPLPLCRVLFSI